MEKLVRELQRLYAIRWFWLHYCDVGEVAKVDVRIAAIRLEVRAIAS